MKTLVRFFLSLCIISSPPFSLASDLPPPALMLAHKYQGQAPVQEYWISEKLDGVRAYWNGTSLVSRQGNIYYAPAWFIADFPDTALDGELWIGRGQFDKLSGVVRKQVPIDKEWQLVSYQIFDLPPTTMESTLSFNQRLEKMKQLIAELNIAWLTLVPQYRLSDESALQHKLQEVVAKGGEGLILHRGNARYQKTRSSDLLKLKPLFDAEAIVLEHFKGKGKYKGMLGSLLVKTDDGITFRIGTGFSDAQRRTPPAIGATITYAYSGLTQNGIPRFARFLRVREAY